jgi:sulfopyruvate decarboxylase TPP-binding subunit
MPLPLITEVVEENTTAAEDKAISQIPATTPTEVVVVGIGIAIIGDTIQPTLKSHNVNYVASLVILFMFVTIGLISHIKTHKTMVLPL